MAKIPIAVQMFTLRNETAHDFAGTLRKVAEIGYTGVEFAGYGGFIARELKVILGDLNLQPAGAHVMMDALEADFNGIMDFHNEIGNRFLAIPMIPQQLRADAAGWRATAERMSALGEKCRAQGITLCYHNHAFEFEKFDGEYGLDILYSASDSQALQAELDLYWVKKGGADPVEYVRKYAGRLPLLHIKDVGGDAEGGTVEVGAGVLDWNAIFAVADNAGVDWYIVEQDECTRPALESIEISYRYLRERGMA